MLNEGNKDYTVQRYKGLGEMCSQQLWETTMDPERRTLLSVKLEDIDRDRDHLHHADGRRRGSPPQVHRRQRAGCEEPGHLKCDELFDEGTRNASLRCVATFASAYPPCYNKRFMSISAIRSRIGTPQLVALLLLLAFALQCVWFSAHQPLTALEGVYIEGGLLHLEGYGHADSRQYTALVPLLAGVAARLSGAERHVSQFNDYRVVLRLPFLLVGLLLGASLWYVARRLYGNIGGYVALGLYCFSPVAVGSASQIGPAIVGAWGGFGLIFTSIAVAHTLYAPREVVLWNWRRILLLGLSIAICVGAQFSFWVLLLPALLFMLWVGHVRPWAALTIFAAACATGLVLLSGFYGFRPVVFAKALAKAEWLEVASPNFFQPGISSLLRDFFLQNGLGLVVLMAVSLVTFIVWKRTRFPPWEPFP